jgi:hypothetical protein
MSQIDWEECVPPLSEQDGFVSDCLYGWQGKDFRFALEALLKNTNLDILAVLGYAVSGDDLEFLRKLFVYYKKNVIDKLQTTEEIDTATKTLRKAVADAIVKNNVENLTEDIKAIIDDEFPDDDRTMENFEDSLTYCDQNPWGSPIEFCLSGDESSLEAPDTGLLNL